MLKKSITYVDYNGVTRTEDFYFNLSKAEAMEMQLSTSGGLTSLINRIVATQDSPAIVNMFKEIILASYGEKSDDGKYFMKTDSAGHRLSDKFAQTEAYSNLFMELLDADKAAEFVNGIVPNDNKIDIASVRKEVNRVIPIEPTVAP